MTTQCWTTGEALIENCDYADGVKKQVTITWQAHLIAQEVTKRIIAEKGKVEWLGYLTGQDNGDRVLITGIVGAKQEVGGASVKVIDPPDGAFIGTIHLHPFSGMPNHSTTDAESIGSNHKVMVITNLDGDYSAYARLDLPCGKRCLVEADVDVAYPKMPKRAVKAVEDIVSKVEVKQITATVTSTPTGNVGYSYLTFAQDILCGNCRQATRAGRYDANGILRCPDCWEQVTVGEYYLCP